MLCNRTLDVIMSKIEWTEKTWNPVVGCRRVSAGCDNCYAITEAHRKTTLFSHYAGITARKDGHIDWSGKFSVAPDHIFEKPLRTPTPTTWFVNSMSDLFGEGVSVETITRVFDIMASTPHHRYQVLTKRPNRAVNLAGALPWPDNIWMGVSIEDDRYVGRADLLRRIPAAVRFISAEPLLGPLLTLNLTDIQWIIVGGESGRSRDKVRPMSPMWARDLRDMAQRSKTAFFFKQWGNWDQNGFWHRSKAEAGRLLDGRTWDEMPGDHAPAWGSVEEFRASLKLEHQAEDAPPLMDGASPRTALREPIWRALRTMGDLDGKALRHCVLPALGLDPESARIVNYHAWALVDLQASGFVEAYEVRVPSSNGRTRLTIRYRAIKPRVRVRAEARS